MDNTHTFFKQKARWLVLLSIVTLLWVAPKEAKASYETYGNSWVSVSFDSRTGYLTIQFVTSDEESGSPDAKVDDLILTASATGLAATNLFSAEGDVNGHSYYQVFNNGSQTLEYYNSNGGWTPFSATWTGNIHRYTTSTSGDHTLYYGRVRWKVPAEWYGKTAIITLSGNWNRNAASDYNISGAGTKPQYLYTINPAIIDNYAFSVQSSSSKVKLDWKISPYNSTNHNSYAKTYLIENNNRIDSSTSYGTSTYSFYIDATASYLNSKHTYKLERSMPENSLHTKTSSDFIVPAYPQATNFSATYDPATRKVKLDWSASIVSGTDYISGDYFQIQRATNSSFTSGLTTITTLNTNAAKYDNTKSSYSVEDDFSSLNTDQTYYYRIRRTHTSSVWAWNYHVSTANVQVSTNHIALDTVYALLDNMDKSNAAVYWEYTGGLWLNGSEFTIKRVNLTNNTEATILSTKDSARVRSGIFNDDMITTCNQYRYKLEIVPANNNYTHHGEKVTDIIEPIEIGNLVSFSADKSYNPDKVVLDWVSDGNFNEFVIKRKVYGSPNSTYQQIKTVAGSAVSTVYQTEDAQGDPGVIYEYSVVGVVSCVGSAFTSNVLTDIGFRRPVGITTGRVTYGTGTAVQGVKVTAETLNPEDEVNAYKSISIASNGNMTVSHAQNIIDSTGFTFQAWVRPQSKANSSVFASSTTVTLGYTAANQLQFKAGNHTLTILDTFSIANKFNHITAVCSQNKLELYINGILAGQQLITLAPFSVNGQTLTIGGNGYAGYMDDIRFWAGALDSASIVDNLCRYLTGNETGMRAYWRFEEAISTTVYDMSSRGNRNFNKNDAALINCTLSDTIPDKSQLAVMGITDENGNYVINAIPYSGTGTNYKFVPMFDVHTFNPTNQLRMIGSSKTIQDGVDFEDVSSFPVRVSVYYEGTGNTFGVEGVSFSVDGQACIQDGQQIVTNSAGEATISVPIGFHNVRAVLNGHTFSQRGYFPYDAVDTTKKYNFQAPRNIEFFDNTLIKITGRVVGGPIEEAYEQGFGMSTNNIGNAAITLKPEKQTAKFVQRDSLYTNNTNQSLQNHSTQTKVKYGDENGNYIIIYPDTLTGEFIAYLLPEKYTIEKVEYGINSSSGSITMDKDAIASAINLTNEYLWKETYKTRKDTVNVGFDEIEINDVNIDTFMYQYTVDFILREEPVISVYNIRGNQNTFFGDTIAFFFDDLTQQTDTIPLKTLNGNYAFEYPVFTQAEEYGFIISAYEAYTNLNNGRLDKVPVMDGELKVKNELSENSGDEILPLDSTGTIVYMFTVTNPNLALSNNPNQSFLLACEFDLFAGGKTHTFPTIDGIVVGGTPTGNNFVTVGPKIVDFVLRDPPGSNSSTYLENGVSVETTREFSNGTTFGAGVETTFKFGQSVKIFAGVGAGTITETEYSNDVVVGTENTNEYVNSNTTKTTTTTTHKISTSDDKEYISAQGDVFVGSAMNIVYGLCNNLGLIPAGFNSPNDAKRTDSIRSINNNKYYTIGRSQGIFLSPSFKTLFSYTQEQIETAVIPNLQFMRNLHLRTDIADPDNFVNNSSLPIYVSRVGANNAAFGSNNNDTAVWGLNGISSNIHDGPSYKMILPANPHQDSIYTDSIRSYNQEIRDWINILANNEKQKLEATLRENRSFDAGVTYESSIQICNGYTKSETWDVDVNIIGNFETGFELNQFGVGLKVSANTAYKYHESTSSSTDSCTTWGFTLSDGDNDNYYSIDIKEAADNSPVFTTRGGQSSCPYEGEIVTKYYKPGEILSYASMRIEQPDIAMESGYNSTVVDVPGNLPAVFKIRLNNISETNSVSWFELYVDETTNPDGAIIKMDGEAVTQNRVFRLLPNQDIQKTITIERGPFQDVNDYENIRLILRSQCDKYNVDSLLLSAYFQPYCSDIVISEPRDNSTVNTISGDTLDIRLTEFDRSNSKFSHISLQYNNGAGWKTITSFYNTQAAYDAAIDKNNRHLITTNDRIDYKFDMHSLPDATYRLRAVSYCYANGLPTGSLDATAYSEEITIIKDMLCPTLFGSIQPADGILDIGDDILITFNETIEEGMITKANFTINGVLNGYDLNHNAGVSFNGTNENIDIPQEMNLIGKSFTAEMWVQPTNVKRSTLFIHGNETKSFAFGFTANGEVFVNVAGTERTSTNIVAQNNVWGHLAVVYDAGNNEINAYWNDIILLFDDKNVPVYDGSGQIRIGADFAGENAFHGNMHDLRIWTKALTQGTVYEQMNQSLSGNENGLIGYWTMDEVQGTIAYDKARKRQAIVNASWFVLPNGKAISFNGTNQYMEADFVTPVGREQDYAISFWFKGTSAVSAGLFSLGNGINDYDPSIDKLSIFIENNNVYVQNNGNKHLITSTDLLDNRWHHFAFSVKRNANTVMYIDGIKVKDLESNLFGGLTSDKFVLGARKWYTSPSATNVDMYFNGLIDEFRMWQFSLTQKIVELDMNAKLTGTEKGLAAYYPFEKYERVQGDMDIVPTLSDQWTNPVANAPNGGTAVWRNGNSSLDSTRLSDDAASIKDARPLQDVNYTWVVNNDRINIVIDEPMKLIENCIIEFTMSDIYDKHGNMMKSPVKWYTYVNRNYLKWAEEGITLQKEALEPLTFKVNAINKSGLQQTFSIENLPGWLSASPSSGTIAPVKELEITFTVDPGLNVGMYDENIYLRGGESGIDELLVLDLRVLGKKPDWNVDPSQYDYSMNIFGELNINGIVSTDEEDMLAAFAGSTCVGVTTLRYVEEYDKYLAFLNVYGNTTGTALSFKIWDASAGTTYVMVTPDTLTFKENNYYGTAKSPIVFKTMNYIEQIIPLKSGWNWISKNVTTPSMTTVNAAFANNTFATGDLLKSQFAGFEQYTANGWAGSISNSGGMLNTQMYMLKAASAKNLTIVGEAVNTATEKVTIYPGWTWIGFTPQINLSVNEAFAAANPKDGDLIKNQNSFSIYYEGVDWLGTLNYLMPGNGYIYYSTSQTETVFSYPNVSSLSNNTKSAGNEILLAQLDKDHDIARNNYQHNLSIVAVLESDEIMPYDASILCYVGNECRGIGNIVYVPSLDNYLYFITVGGNAEGETLSFRLKTETGKVIALKERFTYKSNQLYGSIDQPVVFTIGSPDGSSIAAYPVPFTSELTLEYTVNDEERGLVEFSIMDATGRVLLYFDRLHIESGFYTMPLNDKVNNLSSGVYFITMTTQAGKQTLKAVKTK
jgi:hypothetical protein